MSVITLSVEAIRAVPERESLARAVDIAEKCGATEPAFYGAVEMVIQAGKVTAVDVRRRFITQS